MDKKYELTNITMIYKGRTLHRIKALKDFGFVVKKGDLGGWIENESNLSHDSDCWVYDDGKVYDNGKVYENGMVHEYGEVYDNGAVYKYGQVYGCGEVYGHGKVYEFGRVYENGQVCENGQVYEYGQVYGCGEVYGFGQVCRHGLVFGNGKVCKGLINTKISIPYKEIIQIQCKYRTINALLTKNDEIIFNVGCQDNISKETFIDRIYNENGGLENNPHRQEYLEQIDYMESYLLNKKGEIK